MNESEIVKICCRCSDEKPITEFGVMSKNSDGRNSKCLPCAKEYLSEWKSLNPGKVSSHQKQFNKNRIEKRASVKTARCPMCECLLDRNRGQRVNRRCEECKTIVKKLGAVKYAESRAKYRIENREKILHSQKIHRIRNADKIKAYKIANRDKSNERDRKRRASDPTFRVKCNPRTRINAAIKSVSGGKKSKSTVAILGCSVGFLKAHLQSRFRPGMTWDNYGRGGWEIDHIVPLCVAKTPEEIYTLCHYLNLQPPWKSENLAKRNLLHVV